MTALAPSLQNLAAERAVIGACLLDNDAARAIAPDLDPADFAVVHGAVVTAIRTLAEGVGPIDAMTVGALVKPPAPHVFGAWLLGTMGEVASAHNIRHHLALVRDAALRRRLAKAGTEAVAAAGDAETPQAALDAAEAALAGVQKAGGGTPARTILEVTGAVYRAIEQRATNRRPVTGLSTGLADLDDITAGLHPQHLVIIAGRPAMGKSACAMGIAMHAAANGAPTIVFSLEMSAEELVQRALCAEGRLNAHRIRIGVLDSEDWPRLARAASVVSSVPAWLDDTGAITLAEVRAKCRRLKAQHGLGLVVVDYIQLMKASAAARTREQEVGELSRGLKALAKELGCPVIALSQLNRDLEKRGDKRPQLADLRDSGSLEQDADLVIGLYRDEVYSPDSSDRGIAELIVLKQRAGRTGVVRTRFFGEHTSFENLTDIVA